MGGEETGHRKSLLAVANRFNGTIRRACYQGPGRVFALSNYGNPLETGDGAVSRPVIIAESRPALKVSFNRPRPRSQPARACVLVVYFFSRQLGQL